MVLADSARLQQIYWNLLGNAIKFTPDDGVISIRTYNRSGSATGHTQEVAPLTKKTFFVEFTDTGVGIEAHVIPKLFQAFEQGDEAVNRKFGGMITTHTSNKYSSFLSRESVHTIHFTIVSGLFHYTVRCIKWRKRVQKHIVHTPQCLCRL